MESRETPLLDLDIRDLVMVLWRRRLFIVGVMLTAVIATFLFITLVPPLYAGKAQVMMEARGPVQSDVIAPSGPARVDLSLVNSEAEVIKSRVLAVKVIERLNLMNDPEFNPRLRGTAIVSKIFRAEQKEVSAFKSLSVYPRTQESLSGLGIDAARGPVIDQFLSRLRVRPVAGSQVIQLEFSARTPAKAALIANTLVDAYLDQRLDTKLVTAQKTSRWLDTRLAELRDQVRIADEQVEQYRSENSLIAGSRDDVTAQQLSELNSRLVLAKAQLSEAQAGLTEIEKWRKAPDVMEASPAMLNSRVMQDLKINEAVLQRSLSDLGSRYGAKHPAIIKARAELADVRARIAEETLTIAQGMKNEASLAAAQVASLEKQLSATETVRYGENKAGVDLRALMQEAESSRAILESFLESYKKTEQQELLHEADVRVLSYATLPNAPAFPNKPLFMSLALTGSLFFGVGLALLREKLDGTVHNGAMLESLCGYPAYGIVPQSAHKIKGLVGDYALDHPESPLAESVRTLRMVMNLRANGKGPKVITLTSSLPEEGKTTLSVWLARMTAQSGERVLLIDCDMRRPQVHTALGRAMDHPLSDYLRGEGTLENSIHTDARTGLHVITAGSAQADALTLLSSVRMKEVIATLRASYDLIILDSPACLAVSDARVLACLSDLTLFAVAWEDTPRDIVRAGVKQFTELNVPLAFALTRVDLKRHARYGYGDIVYYYGKYHPAQAA